MATIRSSFMLNQTANQQPADKNWTKEKQAIWHNLQTHADKIRDTNLNALFEIQPKRVDRYQLNCEHITLDFSKNWLTDDIIDTLRHLLSASQFDDSRQALFGVDHKDLLLNFTEQKAVTHIHARHIHEQSAQQHDALLQWSKRLLSGQYLGCTGKPITTVINLGIGGSDLGPKMAIEALRAYQKPALNLGFVSNLDPAAFYDQIQNLNPETTAFIICSKSFNTLETLANAERAKQWLSQHLQEAQAHFFAVTAHPEKAQAFGIPTNQILSFDEGIGGRYSIWSAVGLSLALSIGPDAFHQFIQGAHRADQHFFNAPLTDNLPATLAMISVWYNNFFGAQTHAVIPYTQHLKLLPSYLQQMVMESNGKSTNRHHQRTQCSTSPVIWGDIGTDSQHSFHQLLHQGTMLCPVDFILPLSNSVGTKQDHQQVIANCLAQAHTLMVGQQAQSDPKNRHNQLAQHQYMSGNRPSNLLILPNITPETLGNLIAIYEHKTFVESLIWDINPFDQWGVEMGKTIGQQINQQLQRKTPDSPTLDPSTEYWMAHIRSKN